MLVKKLKTIRENKHERTMEYFDKQAIILKSVRIKSILKRWALYSEKIINA